YTEKDFEEYRRKYIANIFQSFNLINSYTVYQNVELVLLLNGYKKKDVKKKILDIIDKVGLTKFKNTKVSKLSGGQKQRVAIARAMVKDTPIIVADEPTGNLDTESAKEVIEILKKVAKNKLVVVVTHNIEQVEEYATRIIKMHDGRIIENTQVKEVKENIKVEESKYNKITIFNKYRLGIRNTFNIVSKFVLLFAVFFFIIAALFLEYASFELSEYEASKEGYNMTFRDLSENRIVIKKQNNTSFTEEDYQKIKNLSNIDYIVEDDLFLDGSVNLYRDDMSFYGSVQNTENFRGNVDIGRMPENENEIILGMSKEHYYIKNRLEEVLNKSFSISEFNGGNELRKVTIVGIKYSEDNNNYNAKFYLSNTILAELRSHINKNYSDLKILFNDKYINQYYSVLPSNNVEQGKAIVTDELRYQVSNGVVRNKPLNIYVSNIYYNDELNLKISNTYTKSNFKRLTGYDKYDNYRNAIFINTEDYNSMYNKPSYQSSVFIKDVETIDNTLLELENLGLKAKKITDYKVNGNEAYSQIIRIIKVVVTIVLIFVLFFISYFIIRIILKSRNIYYTTLRMLGATYRNVKKILDIELFINSSIAYITMMVLIYLVKINVINFEYVSKLINYLELREYVLMYAILVIMSQLISRRFSKKLFKNTAINTYNEEV
ncbi:MAG: ATP-binding cassette domain-containing protein, partial [Bacilli bacterium]|nr:ATP-binding cassette domain-containing protein [Bacilli bacterium]